MEKTILFYPFDFSLHITHRCHTFGAPSAADGVAIAESSGMSRCEARASNSRKYPIMVNLPTLFVYNFYMSGLNWRIHNYFPCSCANISIMLPYLKLILIPLNRQTALNQFREERCGVLRRIFGNAVISIVKYL